VAYRISVILPCFNEVGSIGYLISNIRSCGLKEVELIVVDDGSTDGTFELISSMSGVDSNLICIRPPVRRGLGLSILDGINAARSDLIAVMDTDGMHDPAYLPLMLSKTEKQNSMVIASRYANGGAMHGALYPHLSRFMNMLVQKITKSKVTDQLCGFFIAEKKMLLEIEAWKFNGFGEYFIYLIKYFETFGSVIEVPTIHNVRMAGVRKSSRGKMAYTYIRTAMKARVST
jgi:dolichol-phosphate mannosyltransferase